MKPGRSRPQRRATMLWVGRARRRVIQNQNDSKLRDVSPSSLTMKRYGPKSSNGILEYRTSSRSCPLGIHNKYRLDQHFALEDYFKKEPNPDAKTIEALAAKLDLEEVQVETWFSIRRKKDEPRVIQPKVTSRITLFFYKYHNTHCCKSLGCQSTCLHSCQACNPEHPRFPGVRDVELESPSSPGSSKIPTTVEAFQRLSVSEGQDGDEGRDEEEDQNGDDEQDGTEDRDGDSMETL